MYALLTQFGDSIYNVPRPLSLVSQMCDLPSGASPAMTPDAAIDAGIYNVPRNLMMDSLDDSRSSAHEDSQYLIGGNPLDIYDYPRVSISPDEEGIYDDPLDIVDMEIYDYPPDAGDLGLEYADWNTPENPRRSAVSAYQEDFMSSGNLKSQPVPPPPSSARPPIVGPFADGNKVICCMYIMVHTQCEWAQYCE